MWLISLLLLLSAKNSLEFTYGKQYTREISIKQGIVRGVIVEPKWNSAVKSVEQYLGLPYAAPPVGEMRFMPPGSAPQWHGVRKADTMGPVCPQKFPDVSKMSADRKEKFNRLKQHLTNQSEDCLYLNIYAPLQEGVRSGSRQGKYPVIVYIHGESYEWNSGNPYDGSVIAAYGEVIFVTINYRLGIFGFLKAGVSEQARSNFGLVDQVAALLWVHENIAAFGGDPGSVTLMGHGTGAACVNFLMVSPMVAREAGKILFQRAILMSGSALADWALNSQPLRITSQVAHQLNCPLGDDDLASCLRRKRLSEIMSVSAVASEFVTRFGPTVDGLVIPNEPKQLMSTYTELFSRYEVMYGVTELESDHLFDSAALFHGFLERERDATLKSYLQAKFEYRPEEALASTLNEYTDVSQTSTLQNRDTVLEILSDARVIAPVVQMADYHSIANPKSYFYVFGHSTMSKQYPLGKSTYGEELPYVFGMPLDGRRELFQDHYTPEERLFSEAIMVYWTNFAKTGNPNAPHRNQYITLTRRDWMQYDVFWPEYEKRNQSYMLLAIPPLTGTKYRQQLMQYWNEILPELLKNQTSWPPKHKTFPPILQPNFNPEKERNTMPAWAINKFQRHFSPNRFDRTTQEPVYAVIKTNADSERIDVKEDMGLRSEDYGTMVTAAPNLEEQNQLSAAMNIIIITGTLFLLVNVMIFAILYHKRYKLKMEERNLKRQYEDMQNANLDLNGAGTLREKVPLPPSELPETPEKGCNVMKMIRQSTKSEDTYEAVKARSEGSSNFKLTRNISQSTIDPHTKVRDWIAQEIVQRCSPRFLRKNRQLSFDTKDGTLKKVIKSSANTSNPPTRPVTPSHKSTTSSQKPLKISVAIDATNDARSSSVLKQEPIELLKSLESNSPPPGNLRRSVTLEDFSVEEKTRPPLKRQNSVTEVPQVGEELVIKINHQHSRSEPVDMEAVEKSPPKLITFDPNRDINVTCKEEDGSNPLMSPEESLQNIKRRNFPKVLPDFPMDPIYGMMKRRSLPSATVLNLFSMPENRSATLDQSYKLQRVPPAPPPRISSTLGRKPSGNRESSGIQRQMSPVKLVEEPPVDSEPEITSNTLHVGPLIPNRAPNKKPDMILNLSQPIYDNLPKSTEDSQKRPKNFAKTIISADCDHPIKRVEPKVIIKPGTSTLKRENKKAIPRVVAKDNSTEDMPEFLKTNSVPPSPTTKNAPSIPEIGSNLSLSNSTTSLGSNKNSLPRKVEKSPTPNTVEGTYLALSNSTSSLANKNSLPRNAELTPKVHSPTSKTPREGDYLLLSNSTTSLANKNSLPRNVELSPKVHSPTSKTPEGAYLALSNSATSLANKNSLPRNVEPSSKHSGEGSSASLANSTSSISSLKSSAKNQPASGDQNSSTKVSKTPSNVSLVKEPSNSKSKSDGKVEGKSAEKKIVVSAGSGTSLTHSNSNASDNSNFSSDSSTESSTSSDTGTVVKRH